MADIPNARQYERRDHVPNIRRHNGKHAGKHRREKRTPEPKLLDAINTAATFKEWCRVIDRFEGALNNGISKNVIEAFREKSPSVLGLYYLRAESRTQWEEVADLVLDAHKRGTLREKDRKDFFIRCPKDGIKQRVRAVIYPQAPKQAKPTEEAAPARKFVRGLEALAAFQA